MKKLDKKIFASLFFSIFAAVMGVGIVVPLLPIYAHELGASGFYIGLIFGAFSFSRSFFLPYFGKLSDQKGRKPFIVAGLFAYALISIAFVFSNSVETLIGIRFIHGIASAMIMPAVQAYIGDITSSGSEGLTMGIFNMSMFFGLSIGPLAGGIINDSFGLNAAFICMGCLAFVGFCSNLLFLPPTKSERNVCLNKKPVTWKQLAQDKDIVGFFFFRFAYTACIGIIWSFLPVFADMEMSLSSSRIGILIMLGVFVSGMLHVPMGFIADRIDKKMMILVGGSLTGLAMLSFEWANSFWYMFGANVLFGIGGGIAMSALMALIVLKGNKIKAMGSVMGLMTMAHSLGMLTGSLLAGLMMDIFKLRQAFSFGSIIMLLGVVLFYIYTSKKENTLNIAVRTEDN